MDDRFCGQYEYAPNTPVSKWSNFVLRLSRISLCVTNSALACLTSVISRFLLHIILGTLPLLTYDAAAYQVVATVHFILAF